MLGQPLIQLEQTTSTNDVARAEALRGAPEGLTVLAQHQTQGRGRQGRRWESAPGLGVWLSVLLRPPWPEADSGWLAVLGGLATITALAELGVPQLRLKWPNDVLVGGRKIAGLLVEPRTGAGRIEFAVLGVGINVAHQAPDFPETVRATATSCRLAGVTTSAAAVAERFLRCLEREYAAGAPRSEAAWMSAWTQWGGGAIVPPPAQPKP